MPVHSEQLNSRGRSLSPQVIPRHTVEGGAIVMLWIIAILLWLASTFGNFVQFVGGWERVWPLNEQTATGVLYALIYQGIATVAQWGFKAKRWWALYALALLASAIPSFMTYNSWWINPWIVARLGPSVPLPLAWLIASAVIFVATAINDLIPEWVLVE